MLTIRPEQMKAMEAYMLQRFRERMAAHLRAHFPKQTAPLDAQGLDEHIRRGLDKGRAYGVATEYDCRRFLEFVTTYGLDFERDRTLSWAVEALRDPSRDATARMDRLDWEEQMHVGRQR